MINNLIADGGYAFVYKERTAHSGCDWRRSISFFACLQATDVATGKEFALKKMICGDKESYDIACKEARFMQQLSPHPNIVQLHATSEIKGSSGTEVYFLMDLCTGGTLIDIMDRFEKKRSPRFPPCQLAAIMFFAFVSSHLVVASFRLSYRQLLQMFFHISRAVMHMHSQPQPITHRDMKLENVLLHRGSGMFKLCDFGSCTLRAQKYTVRREVRPFKPF